MSDGIPRLRMFAGPNGSGKTTVKSNLGKSPEWFGIYINSDDLEKTVRDAGFVSLRPYQVNATTNEVRDYFVHSPFLNSQQLTANCESITWRDDGIDFGELAFTAYHASVLSDFLRHKALESSRSFSFETVMSAPDKIQLLRDAQSRGFRTYLYYIATEDPEINVQRVANRVADNGHDVPEHKIVSRYYRSLELLLEAIPHTNRAYFFDTSTEEAWFFAQVTNGTHLELEYDEIPSWFNPVWEHFDNASSESP